MYRIVILNNVNNVIDIYLFDISEKLIKNLLKNYFINFVQYFLKKNLKFISQYFR